MKKKAKGNQKTDMLKTGRGMEEGEFRMKMEYVDNTRSIEAILKLSSTY